MIDDKLRISGFLTPIMPRVVGFGLKAIESVEVTHGIRQIGSIESQTIARNEVLRVVVNAENTMVFCCVRSLHVNRMDILGVLRTIAIIIDVSQHTSLKTIVRIIGDRRKNTEVPTGLDLPSQRIHFLRFGFFFLSRSRNNK